MNQLTCSVPNCARPSRLAGLCGAHHQRKLRHGDVRAHIPLKGTDVDPSAFWCSKCHTHKQKAAFHAEPRARRGISGVCKDCVKSRRDEIRPRLREQSKRAKTKDPEKTKRLKRESYLREDPEKRAARNRAWRTSDMERYRRQMRRDRAVRSRRARNAAGSCSQAQLTARWNYLADNYQSQLAELIYSDPRFTRNIKDGKIVDPSFYGAATMQQHENHVHAASKEPLGAPSGAGKDAAPAAPDTRTEREKIADQVIAEGKRRGISDKGIKAAVMTALAETDLQNLDYGMDGDNAGIMQQRDNGGWGTLEDRKDPTRAAGMFYDKLDDFDYNSMSEAEAAQKVQQSGTADGSNYAVKAAEADEIIAASNARGNGSQMTVGTTDSGAALATDGQRVFVTNWPGTSSSSYSAPESAPSPAPAGGTSDAAGKDPNLIWSGGFKVFENGGMNLPDQAGLYSDGADLIRFAEKGTGGESYIPHAPSKRNRSVAITRETARRFGYELVPMADGGLSGFGGYVGEKPGLKVPTTANGRRAAAYNAAAFGVGATFALASGFDADGKFTGQFDTGSNSSSQLEKGFENATKEIQPVLEAILLAIKNREPIRAEVNVDRDSGMANINILKGGI